MFFFSENIHTPPTEGLFGSDPHLCGNSSLGLYIPLKILFFQKPTSPSEFPLTLCGGVWIFSGTTHFLWDEFSCF